MSNVDFTDIRLSQQSIAGQTVPVAVVPRIRTHNYFLQVPFAIKSLWNGMKLTIGYFLHPSRIVTRQYPENRATLKFPERYRANLRLEKDESGLYFCNGCKSCERACPNASLIVSTRKGAVTGKNELDAYVWRMDSCTFCNACVMACPTGALKMGPEFESAVYDRRLLIYTLNRHAGPTPDQMSKLDEETRKQVVLEKRGPYDGPVPLAGVAYPNICPIVLPGQTPAREENA